VPINADNWHRFNPPNFTVTTPGAEIAAAGCSLHLRPFDVKALTALLTDRGFNVALPERYNRAQGRAARYTWWRDGKAVIPRALLVLCAITQDLKPEAELPAPCHHCGDKGRISYRDTTGRMRDTLCPSTACAAAIALVLGDPPPDLTSGFPFRPRDGLRGDPRDVLPFGEGFLVPKIEAHLPRVIRDRLAECGRNYHDQGLHGVGDPGGKFYPLNRSAAVRRLLEAVRVKDPRVRLDAPIHFRGVELFARPITPEQVQEHPRHFIESTAQMWEAQARNARKDKLPEAVSLERIAARVRAYVEKCDARGEYPTSRGDKRLQRELKPFERDLLIRSLGSEGSHPHYPNYPQPPAEHTSIPPATPAAPHTNAVPAGTIAKQPKRSKLRGAHIEKFDPEKLG
jgi:hypothetical protein